MTAAILSGVWLLWPILSLTGAAFAPLAGVLALLLFPLAAPKLRPRTYMIALIAFFGYAAMSSLWSPKPIALFDIDFAKGDFNVRSEVIRVGGAFLSIGILLAATKRLDMRGRAMVMRFASISLMVQLGIIIILTVFEDQILDFLWHAGAMPNTGEGVQNITRNCIMMAVAAPFLIQSVTENRSPRVALLIAAAILAIEMAIVIHRGNDAGTLALIAGILAVVIVAIWRRNGYRIIACGIALIVWTAPMFFGFLSLHADETLSTTSADQRLAIWKRVVVETSHRPIEGNGVGVLRTMNVKKIGSGKFADQPEIPNHPHNMTLQLWVETGAIGSALLAISIILAGWRLPPPEKLGLAAPRVAALAGGMTVVACFSFDLWNEWWWSAGGFLAVLASVVAREGDLAEAAVQYRNVRALEMMDPMPAHARQPGGL